MKSRFVGQAAPRETPLEALPPLSLAALDVFTPPAVSPGFGTFGVAPQSEHFCLAFRGRPPAAPSPSSAAAQDVLAFVAVQPDVQLRPLPTAPSRGRPPSTTACS